MGHIFKDENDLEFMMFFDEDHDPVSVEHYFQGTCPYCKKEVKPKSLCLSHGTNDGNITRLWGSLNS